MLGGMTEPTVPSGFSARWQGGQRADPPMIADEATMLTSYLEYYRSTFELKCAGVAGERLSEATVPPSTISLHGLIRHLAGVERWWMRQQFAGEDVPMLYYSDEDPDQDFESLGGDVGEALATWRAECERSREIVAAADSLEATGVRRGTGEAFSLRWVLLRMITEYARHCGHADLLRERIDGAVGE